MHVVLNMKHEIGYSIDNDLLNAFSHKGRGKFFTYSNQHIATAGRILKVH